MELKRHLQSLACAKFKVLKKHPAGRDVNPSDSFSFNADFSAPLQKIKISTIASRVENTEERKETRDRIDEERCQTLGGPENLFQLCDPPKRQFRPTTDDFGTFDTVGPGSTEVLRVIDVAPNRGPAS